MKKASGDSWWVWAVRLLPFLLILAGILLFGSRLRGMSAEDILQYTPPNAPLAALVLIGFYAVKSLSVVFPLLALYLCAGILFPLPVALLVNAAGLLVCITVPYLLGRLAGHSFVDRMTARYARVQALNTHKTDHALFFCFFLRVINLLPGDIVSMVLGASRTPFLPYAAGSMLGLLPTMAAATFLGESITDWTSPKFYLSLAAVILLSAVSFWGYRRYVRRRQKPPQ